MSADNAEVKTGPEAAANPLAALVKTAKIAGALYFALVIVFAVSYFMAKKSNPGLELGDTQWPYVFTVVNCFLLFLFLYLGLKSPVAKMLDEAAEQVRQKLQSARAASHAAEDLAQKNERLQAELANEKKQLEDSLDAEKQRDKDKILAQAKAEAQDILDGVKSSLDAELESAKNALRRELAAQAVKEAKEQIASAVTTKDGERIFNAFIAEMEKPS